MILNLIRTITELSNYLARVPYPRARIGIYLAFSIFGGALISQSPNAAELPFLTLIAILFGFTINAVVMLGNYSEHYLSGNLKHHDQLEKYYEKSVHLSIHTLGVGIIAIVIIGIFQLFPDFNVYLFETELVGMAVTIELISTIALSVIIYYLFVFTIVIASMAELVKIRILAQHSS